MEADGGCTDTDVTRRPPFGSSARSHDAAHAEVSSETRCPSANCIDFFFLFVLVTSPTRFEYYDFETGCVDSKKTDSIQSETITHTVFSQTTSHKITRLKKTNSQRLNMQTVKGLAAPCLPSKLERLTLRAVLSLRPPVNTGRPPTLATRFKSTMWWSTCEKRKEYRNDTFC